MKNTKNPKSKIMKRIGVALLVILVAIAAIVLLGQFNQAQTNQRLKTDIETTHSELKTIAADLTKQTGMKWVDKSECYRLNPRLFGEDYKPVCNVRFNTAKKSSVKKYTQLYENMVINGERLSFGSAADLQFSLENTTGFNVTGQLHENRPCVASYIYIKDEQEVHGEIRCYYEINQSTFDYVTSKNVLPVGEDRF